jgi:hypothetical protein
MLSTLHPPQSTNGICEIIELSSGILAQDCCNRGVFWIYRSKCSDAQLQHRVKATEGKGWGNKAVDILPNFLWLRIQHIIILWWNILQCDPLLMIEWRKK